MTIQITRDHNGNIRTNEADFFHNGVPLKIVERSGLEPSHDGHKILPPFRPAAANVDVVCVRNGRLRISNLLSIMLIESHVQIGKSLSNCLLVARHTLLS